jgi:hypothetical protein
MPTKSILLARNSRVEEDSVDQLFNSSEKRLARTPLLLANFSREGRPEPIIGKVSHVCSTQNFHGWNSEQLLWVEC